MLEIPISKPVYSQVLAHDFLSSFVQFCYIFTIRQALLLCKYLHVAVERGQKQEFAEETQLKRGKIPELRFQIIYYIALYFNSIFIVIKLKYKSQKYKLNICQVKVFVGLQNSGNKGFCLSYYCQAEDLRLIPQNLNHTYRRTTPERCVQ